jgi:hypothetical protein
MAGLSSGLGKAINVQRSPFDSWLAEDSLLEKTHERLEAALRNTLPLF